MFQELGQYLPLGGGLWSRKYRFGTCEGLFFRLPDRVFCLLAVLNTEPGNGDFARLMDYLEARYHVQVLALMNRRLRRHLIRKRGYRWGERIAGPGNLVRRMTS